MKLPIVSIAIIIVLIVFFVIVDRKEFTQYNICHQDRNEDSVRGKKIEADSPSSIKKNTESFLIRSPLQTSSSLSTDKQSEEELAPAAVPVATPEEVIDLNEKAMAYALAEGKKREPFSSFYQNSKIETICFQGTVRATSIIPNPEKNDYDNCLYALFVEIDSLLSSEIPDTKIAGEVIINVPIMKDKTILQENRFLPGDKIWCTCSEYDSMPQSIQEIQLSDDIQSYEHQQYFSIAIRKISTFLNEGNRNFAKREITILPIQTLPKDEKASALRRERIQNEIARVEEEIKKHGGSFEIWKEQYKPIAERYKQLCSEGWKGWINDSFFAAIDPESSNYNTNSYINGIMPYKKYLDDNNIDLILMRFPSRADFAARVLGADDFQENPAWIEHYYECLKNDIEIVDPMPEMWKHRFDYPLFYFYNHPTEQHPFEGEMMIAASVLSEVIKRYSIPREESPVTLSETSCKSSAPMFLWPSGNPKYKADANITFRQSIQNDDSIGTLRLNSAHPVLILSNSYFGTSPFRDLGASLPAYLSFFLQSKPDWSFQAGIGNAMIRNLISSPEVLAKRQAVVMIGAYDAWIGSFPHFPKYILDNAKRISLEKTMDLLSPDISIIDNDSFVFRKNDNGVTEFTQNTEKKDANRDFKIQLSIPPGPEGENTCMLRITYSKNTYMVMNVRDSETGRLLDTTALAPGNNIHTDFFIPVSSVARKISIQFSPTLPNHVFSIQKIELWYY